MPSLRCWSAALLPRYNIFATCFTIIYTLTEFIVSSGPQSYVFDAGAALIIALGYCWIPELLS